MTWTRIGFVGVDSGQLLVCDPCYIDGQWKKNRFQGGVNETETHEFSYDGCCKASLTKKGYGQLNYEKGHAGVGVAFSSGDGDGVYPVYARFVEGRIAEIKIKMIEEVK